MFDNPAFMAVLKIALTFTFMLFAISRRWHLWLAIFLGGVFLGLLFGLSPLAIGRATVASLSQPTAFTLFGVVFFIMLLSAIQGEAGQGRRLALGLTPYMKSPRLRLAFFPALMGLLGVPGGAIFSCPMVRDLAEGYDITNRKLVLVNYWFRHIWELAWPLYPDFLLICILTEVSPAHLIKYTFPFVIMNCVVGWLFFLRTPIERLPHLAEEEPEKRPLLSVLMDGLPIVVGIGFAPVISMILEAFSIHAPSGGAFVISFFLASIVALIQNKMPLSSVPGLMMQPQVAKMLALVLMVFVFKDIVIEAQVVDALTAATGKGALLLLALTLPAALGILTGILIGFVGPGLPLLLALLSQAGLYEERLCWVILSVLTATFGAMITPMHSCFLVTLEFFKEQLVASWLPIFYASLTQLALACVYLAGLYFFVKPLLP